jgi:hypothetical protein
VQFFPANRFDDVFVGPGIDRAHAIHAIISPGNDDDLGPMQKLPDIPTDLETICPRHKQIAKDQLRLVFQGEPNAGFCVTCFESRPVLAGEEFRGVPPALGVVLNQQNGRH